MLSRPEASRWPPASRCVSIKLRTSRWADDDLLTSVLTVAVVSAIQPKLLSLNDFGRLGRPVAIIRVWPYRNNFFVPRWKQNFLLGSLVLVCKELRSLGVIKELRFRWTARQRWRLHEVCLNSNLAIRSGELFTSIQWGAVHEYTCENYSQVFRRPLSESLSQFAETSGRSSKGRGRFEAPFILCRKAPERLSPSAK